MNEIQEFALFNDFLDSFEEPLVGPRDATPLEDEQRDLLSRIADGESTQEDLDNALQMLCSNSTAMEFFAKQLQTK